MSQRLSFVMTVHRGQAYLTDSIRSILGHTGADVELVAVDNASPDHAPELLDELARADDRLVVLHLPEVVPAGVALDAGLGVAAAVCAHTAVCDSARRAASSRSPLSVSE